MTGEGGPARATVVLATHNPGKLAELRRIHAIARQQLRPFIDGMPKRGEAAGPAPAEVASLLALPPAYRPGGSGGA